MRDPSWPESVPWSQRTKLPIRIQQELARDPYWPAIDIITDEERRIDIPSKSVVLDPKINSDDFRQCVERVDRSAESCCVVHTFIPEWTNDADLTAEIAAWPPQRVWIPEIQRLDWARDHHHYDIVTAQKLAQDIKNKLLS